MLIFSDPHIGKHVVANTTLRSRKRWKASLVSRCKSAMANTSTVLHETVCVGDLFDADQMLAADLLDGLAVAQLCTIILGGNHDVENSSGSVSALSVVDSVVGNVVMPVFNSATVVVKEGTSAGFFVPHQTSKDLFAEALEHAKKEAEKFHTPYLFLHCNYDCDFASKATELNLTRQDAENLLKVFSKIFIGHDHNYKTDFDGRLVVVGSISPTSFGDAESTHGYLDLNPDTGEVTRNVVWDPADSYLELDVGTFLTSPDLLAEHPKLDLLRVTGSIEPSRAVEFSKYLRKFWAAADEAERLYAIKVEVRIQTAKADTDAATGRAEVRNLKTIIQAELNGSPELLALWNDLLEEMQ